MRHRNASQAVLFATLWFAPTSVLAIPPPPIPPPPPGTTTFTDKEMSAAPTGQLIRQLFDAYAEKFVEQRLENGPVFYTKSRAAFDGVCEAEKLSFALSRETRRADEPVAPAYVSGVFTISVFAFVDAPVPFDPTRVEGYNATKPLCDALRVGTEFISAPSARVAGWQRFLIERAVNDAQSRKPLKFGLRCIRDDLGAPCDGRVALAKINANRIRSIYETDCGVITRDNCYSVTGDKWTATVRTRLATYEYTLSDPPEILVSLLVAPAPDDVTSQSPAR